MSTKPPAKPRRSRANAPRANAPGSVKPTPDDRSRDTQAPAPAVPEPIKETIVDNQNEMPDPAAVEARAEKMKADAKAAFSGMGAGQMGEAMKKTTEMASGMTEMAKGGVEAMVESSRIAATGAQDFATHMAEYNRRTFEHVSAAMKDMTQAKSPTELFKLQSDYAQRLFDLAIAETSRTTEAMMKLAGEVGRPMQNQIAEATAKVRGR